VKARRYTPAEFATAGQPHMPQTAAALKAAEVIRVQRRALLAEAEEAAVLGAREAQRVAQVAAIEAAGPPPRRGWSESNFAYSHRLAQWINPTGDLPAAQVIRRQAEATAQFEACRNLSEG
jgi:hypothetical protein